MNIVTKVEVNISEKEIEIVCKLLHREKRSINKKNVVDVIKAWIREFGTTGIKLMSKTKGLRTYKGIEKDVQLVCEQMGILQKCSYSRYLEKTKINSGIKKNDFKEVNAEVNKDGIFVYIIRLSEGRI